MQTQVSSTPAVLSLPKTNLPADEMIPDTENPAHDPLYWCLPPIREDLSVPYSGGGKPLHLVTRGHRVGIFRNWTVAKTMVTGYAHGANHGHQTMAGCVAEWQEHCILGVHPHAPDPAPHGELTASPSPKRTLVVPRSGVSLIGSGQPVPAELQADMKRFCMPVLDKDKQPPSSSTRFFAIWNGCEVYTKSSEAKAAFMKATKAGKGPTLLTTLSYDEALAYSVGVRQSN